MGKVTWREYCTFQRQLRVRAGFSQKVLAEHLGCSVNHIYPLEAGLRHPSRTLLHALLKICQTEAYEQRLTRAFEYMLVYHYDVYEDDD